MKQVQIVLGIVLTLALCYGAVLASGGFEADDGNDTAGIKPVIAGGAFISQVITNETNATENVTVNETGEPETGIVNSITGVFNTVIQNVVKTSSSGGSSHSSSTSGGSSSSSSSTGETTTTPTATETPCPTTGPTANETVTPDETATPCPAENTTVEPTPIENTTIEPTPTEIEPTPTPNDPVPSPTSEILTGPGTAGVTRTYYHIANHDTKTTSIIVESEFPAEFADMEYYTLMDHVYEFSKVELRHIYYYYNSPNIGPNGEGLFGDYAGGYYLGSRMGRTRWAYPVAETAILIYSDDVRFYVISTVDFTQSVSIDDPYTGEPGYIPCKFFDKGYDNAGMPEKQPGKPRYYDMPLAAQVRFQLEHGFPDYYAPVKPTPEPTVMVEPTPTEPVLTPQTPEPITPTPTRTPIPTVPPVEDSPITPTPTSIPTELAPLVWDTPTPTPAQATPASTPIDEPIPKPTVDEPVPEETSMSTPEVTAEPPKEQTPVEGENKTN
jgi:hypothetical protein